MKALFFALTFLIIGAAIGYFGRGSLGTVHYISHNHKPLVEVRDQYFRKCELEGATSDTDKITREYKCERLKVQLVQRWKNFATSYTQGE